MPTGKVKFYDEEKGFGFVSSDDGQEVFLPSSALPEFTVKPVVQREAAPATDPAPASGAADAAPTEKELDQLAQQLFGRLRTRLRAEVIQEREARGLGFDAF